MAGGRHVIAGLRSRRGRDAAAERIAAEQGLDGRRSAEEALLPLDAEHGGEARRDPGAGIGGRHDPRFLRRLEHGAAVMAEREEAFGCDFARRGGACGERGGSRKWGGAAMLAALQNRL